MKTAIRTVDRRLVIRKEGQPAIIPHENWRGQFSCGTYTSGAVSDCGPGQTTGCTAIAWPGHRTNAWHQRSGSGPDIRTWFGGLVDGMRDASGQMYMRNRYYDPATGQFTQTDPIGLAGGLNAYGFAAGDPVTFSDPYGLCFNRIGRDYHSGECGSDQQYFSGAQERHACTRNEMKACIEYPATDRQWDRIGHKIRRLRTHTTYCRGAKGALLGLWNTGRPANRIRFWDGYDIATNSDGSQEQYSAFAGRDAHGDYVAFDPKLAFTERSTVPHEGLHLFYRHNPIPGIGYLELHALIYAQDGTCAP